MRIVAVIPARMGSSRFPGKPIKPILGVPMIEHVYRRTTMCPEITQTFIATCDHEIKVAAEEFGAPVIMTSSQHERASDRVAEASEKIEGDVLVLVQGDEPLTNPQAISAAIKPFLHRESVGCVNLMKRIIDYTEFHSANVIKVIVDKRGNALFMSRQPIPTNENGLSEVFAYKQVCIIPFSRRALQEYKTLPPTPYEIAESIDMMRFIEHGISVQMIETEFESYAVDVPEDIGRVERVMHSDPLVSHYLN